LRFFEIWTTGENQSGAGRRRGMIDSSHLDVVEAVRRALEEDIGPGDVTSEACIPAGREASGEFIAREAQVVAGVELLPLIYQLRGGVSNLKLQKSSGEKAAAGDVIASVSGNARTLLACERVALNFVQRLSGISTLTARYVAAVAGTNAKILDTRKTTPLYRRLEKYAVRAGGGLNHRMDLSAGVLIKDNHLAAVDGDIALAVKRVRAVAPMGIKIEVECDTLEQVGAAVDAGADVVLLDNMGLLDLREAVKLAAGRAVTEASGGVKLDTVRAIAETGVNWISVGALTHSAPALDLGLDFD